MILFEIVDFILSAAASEIFMNNCSDNIIFLIFSAIDLAFSASATIAVFSSVYSGMAAITKHIAPFTSIRRPMPMDCCTSAIPPPILRR